MDCSNCQAPLVTFAIPEDLQEHAPAEASAAGLCTSCLSLQRVEAGETGADLTQVSEAFPDGDAAVPMALIVGLLDSVALYRDELAALVETVEEAGVDPFLVLSRLESDGGLDPDFDLRRRRRQLEQFLE